MQTTTYPGDVQGPGTPLYNTGVDYLPPETHRASQPVQNTFFPDAPGNKFKAKEIIIRACDNGYMVTVGCQSFCVENSTNLIAKLSRYLSDPHKVENDYLEKGYDAI